MFYLEFNVRIFHLFLCSYNFLQYICTIKITNKSNVMTNLNLIVGKNKVFGTYVKTICFTENFTNEEEKSEAMNNAKIVIYNYAESFGIVHLNTIHDERLNSNDEVFKFLEKCNQ